MPHPETTGERHNGAFVITTVLMLLFTAPGLAVIVAGLDEALTTAHPRLGVLLARLGIGSLLLLCATATVFIGAQFVYAPRPGRDDRQ
jgi:hypothetical protein